MHMDGSLPSSSAFSHELRSSPADEVSKKLRGGVWDGKEVLPKNWSTHITRMVTKPTDVHPGVLTWEARPNRWGYGMMWWVWDAPNMVGAVTGPYQGAYTAMGANGQYVTVLPACDMVVTIKVDFEKHPGYDISLEEYATLLNMAINSDCHGECVK